LCTFKDTGVLLLTHHAAYVARGRGKFQPEGKTFSCTGPTRHAKAGQYSFFIPEAILRTFHLVVDFKIVLYKGMYGWGEGEPPPPSPGKWNKVNSLCPALRERECYWKGWALKVTKNSQHSVQNTEYSCSKTHVHKITNVLVFFIGQLDLIILMGANPLLGQLAGVGPRNELSPITIITSLSI
jgi:hypothetical protein